jgi:hypothetical protein
MNYFLIYKNYMGLALLKIYNFDESSIQDIKEITKNLTKESEKELKDDNVYCAICDNVISNIKEKTTVAGSFQHTFTNPSNYIFNIGCFKSAPGCSSKGLFTDQFTWFNGYSWKYALCGSCGSHLGWVYRDRGKSGFFGLILDRIKYSG